MKNLDNKKNSSHFINSNLNCFCKEFLDLTAGEIALIKKIKSENFNNSDEETFSPISISDRRSHHFLIFQNDRLLAYSRLVPPSYNFNKLTLEKFCVSKDYRSKGISKILMELVFKKSQVLYPLEILNLSSLVETKKFYEKFGFSSSYFIYDENGNSHYQMTKSFK